MKRLSIGTLAIAIALCGVLPGTTDARDGLLPTVHTALAVTPSPIPAPSEGRIPVSLRLADTISTDDGTHPPAATEVRFEVDKHFRLDLSRVPRCPWAPSQSYPAFDWSSCEAAIVASGRIKWEIAFPEQEPVRVGNEAIVYRGKRNKLLIRTHVPAPGSGEIVIPVELSPVSEGRYGLKATASIPKVASGSGSLTYLGWRFHKGLFSAACPKGRLQFGVRNSFDGGEVSGGALLINC